LQFLKDRHLKLSDLWAIFIPRCADVKCDGVGGIESRIDVAEVVVATQQKPRAGEQYHRHGELRNYQSALQTPPSARNTTRRLRQRRCEIASRGLQCRQDTEHDGRARLTSAVNRSARQSN
jgi:hypothetical protein